MDYCVESGARQEKSIHSPTTSRAFARASVKTAAKSRAQNAGVETFQAWAGNNMCGRLNGCLLVKKPQRWLCSLLAAPSTGLPEYLRIVSAWEISCVHGNKTQLPRVYAFTSAKGEDSSTERVRGSSVRSYSLCCGVCCYHAGSFPYVSARRWRRCQTLRGAVLGNGPPCLELQQSSSQCACARLHAVKGSL